MKILVINCGSSSLKYQLMDMSDLSVLCKGVIERIGIVDRFHRFPAASKSIASILSMQLLCANRPRRDSNSRLFASFSAG